MIKDFGFIIPQNCQFGMGALKKLPDFLKAAGSDNVMLISDRGLEAIGVVDKVREIIKGANLKYSEYLDVLPNPTTTIVDECAAQYKAAGCTAIIALGGGSPMDVAKAVSDVKAGKVEYRVDKSAIIHCPIGKASFGTEKLTENLTTLMEAINKAKPAAAKGTYVRSLYISATMGPAVKVNPLKF